MSAMSKRGTATSGFICVTAFYAKRGGKHATVAAKFISKLVLSFSSF
jgi:hypothetical protein